MPGARTWQEAQADGQVALSGLQGHLAIPPPPENDGSQPQRSPTSPIPPGPRPVPGYRLQLAVAAAARDGDQAATAAIIREGARQGLDPVQLLAVAARHWPAPRLPVRAWRTSRRWAAERLRRLHRPGRRARVLVEQERQS
jgi:hypothetical protein